MLAADEAPGQTEQDQDARDPARQDMPLIERAALLRRQECHRDRRYEHPMEQPQRHVPDLHPQ